MRFEWNAKAQQGGCELIAHPDDYDGHPPVSSLRLDYSPRYTTSARVAAAAVLAFRPFLSGTITFHAGVPAEFASAVEDLLAPTAVFPNPVDLQPKGIPVGVAAVQVHGDGGGGVGRDTAVSELVLRSSGRTFGHTINGHRIEVSTNASRLVPASGRGIQRALPYVAAAVLMAEDFGWGELLVEATNQNREDDLFLQRLSGLAATTGLKLSGLKTPPLSTCPQFNPPACRDPGLSKAGRHRWTAGGTAT